MGLFARSIGKAGEKAGEMDLKQGMERMRRMGNMKEGRRTEMMEQVTARFPSNIWLFAAGASILGALGLRIAGKTQDANFVGAWAPTLLTIGVYNKIVKVLGSD